MFNGNEPVCYLNQESINELIGQKIDLIYVHPIEQIDSFLALSDWLGAVIN
jgi:hypothetical protein